MDILKLLKRQQEEISECLEECANAKTKLEANHIAFLEELLRQEHDCKIDDGHGCDCLLYKEELRKLKGESESIIN